MLLTECPRDAIQGLKTFIPTEKKAAYLNYLLGLNLFEKIDFGSFVSPKAIPQMADTKDVIPLLDLSATNSKLLAIVANLRGAEDAVQFPEIAYLGYPFSVSETFQLRNTNSTIDAAFESVQRMQETAVKNDKKLLIYLSMAFGNPYGDAWHADIINEWLAKMQALGIRDFALSDTIGMAEPHDIYQLSVAALDAFPDLAIGLHLHSSYPTAEEKVIAAQSAGITKMDGAVAGYGGCPMAKDELVGNMPTETILRYFNLTDEATIAELENKFRAMIA